MACLPRYINPASPPRLDATRDRFKLWSAIRTLMHMGQRQKLFFAQPHGHCLADIGITPTQPH